jgi:hypothetical protein
MASSAHIVNQDQGERLELALKTVAYVVLAHGAAYIPLLERLESEMAKTTAQRNAAVRAELILQRYTRELYP